MQRRAVQRSAARAMVRRSDSKRQTDRERGSGRDAAATRCDVGWRGVNLFLIVSSVERLMTCRVSSGRCGRHNGASSRLPAGKPRPAPPPPPSRCLKRRVWMSRARRGEGAECVLTRRKIAVERIKRRRRRVQQTAGRRPSRPPSIAFQFSVLTTLHQAMYRLPLQASAPQTWRGANTDLM